MLPRDLKQLDETRGIVCTDLGRARVHGEMIPEAVIYSASIVTPLFSIEVEVGCPIDTSSLGLWCIRPQNGKIHKHVHKKAHTPANERGRERERAR